ncbi:hypothetical protein J3R83DRAFT_2113 [Lanmaoa asiatica]|nr:hypothetical protein J3R83DRAFT_2113 [Lanmaoa asiatica]
MLTPPSPLGPRRRYVHPFILRLDLIIPAAITGLGDDVRYDVIKPVLECCSADTLLRLEQSSPVSPSRSITLSSLIIDPISGNVCASSPILYLPNNSHEMSTNNLSPGATNISSKNAASHIRAQLLREAEAHRLEEAASRLRNQRMEAAERKKEREVKLTDKLPPAKRARTAWGTSNQPKSLFQKTKNEATKLRRSLYSPRSALQIPTTASPLVAPSTKSVNSRITVKTVSISRPSTSAQQTTPRRPVQSTNSADPVSQKDFLSPPQLPSPAHPPSQATEPRPSKPPIQKRDPMASLFMPKHRSSHSSPQVGNHNRSVPAR